MPFALSVSSAGVAQGGSDTRVVDGRPVPDSSGDCRPYLSTSKAGRVKNPKWTREEERDEHRGPRRDCHQ